VIGPAEDEDEDEDDDEDEDEDEDEDDEDDEDDELYDEPPPPEPPPPDPPPQADVALIRTTSAAAMPTARISLAMFSSRAVRRQAGGDYYWMPTVRLTRLPSGDTERSATGALTATAP
jgi:hypothetical protein